MAKSLEFQTHAYWVACKAVRSDDGYACLQGLQCLEALIDDKPRTDFLLAVCRTQILETDRKLKSLRRIG